MTKMEVKAMLKALSALYPSYEMPTDQIAISIWTNTFAGKKNEWAILALKRAASKCKYPPTMAEILEEYTAIESRVEAVYQQRKNMWDLIVRDYPDWYTDEEEATEVINKALKRVKPREWGIYLQWISKQIDVEFKKYENREIDALPMLSDLIRKLVA